MKKFVTKYEIWIFLALAPIVNTIVTYVNSKGIIYGFVHTHIRFYVLLLLLISIVGYTKGFIDVKRLFEPMLKWRINPKWYLFSLLFPITIALIIRAGYYGTDLSSVFKISIPPLKTFVILMTWVFLREVVWVSYPVRELSKIIRLFNASQIIRCRLALWWLPSV